MITKYNTILAPQIVFEAGSMQLSVWPEQHTADWRSNVGSDTLSAYTVAEHRLKFNNDGIPLSV